ncbi:MAG: hypothetical protein K2W94_02975 [Alphaproteobacteria bacterium]|nr:hypothetical protein [Alphaproteobacteria bacterium]
MKKISKSLLSIALMSTMLAGVSYAADAGAVATKSTVTPAEVEAAKRNAEELAAALAAKNQESMAKVDNLKTAASDKAAQLEIEKKLRAEKRAREAEERRLAEEARIKAEAEEEERLLAEEAVKQKEIEAAIEAEAQKAAEKAKKRAEKAKMATDLVALKEEAAKLGIELAEKERLLGDRDAEIVQLKSTIENMKVKEAEVAKTIIAHNKTATKILQTQVAENLGTSVDTARKVEGALAGLKTKAAASKKRARDESAAAD